MWTWDAKEPPTARAAFEPFLWSGFSESNMKENGARGRDRTTDTAIFSRMLYQLSYPGTGFARPVGLLASGGYRQGV